jgi:UDP-glucose 4-epimerase
MRFLLAGGAGEVGRALSAYLRGRGHAVTIFDKAAWPVNGNAERLTAIRGDLQDKALVLDAVRAADVVVNLAWSFSDEAATVFCEDIGGHVNLLEAAAASRCRRFIYTSSAVVYGTPQGEPVTEEHPCLTEKARKPLYALGKRTAEELCGIYGKDRKLPVTVARFWWAFGGTVGGRHLREMMAAAVNNEPLKVVAGAGGTFVTMNDLAAFVDAVAGLPASAGGVYNIGSLFLTWAEIATMIIETVGSRSCLLESSGQGWNGPAFLKERWRLSWERAAAEVGFRPAEGEASLRQAFRQALAECASRATQGVAHG